MKYEPKDLPSIKNFDRDIPPLKTILKLNKFLTFFGLGSKNIKDLELQFDQLLKQKEELEEYPTKFNRYFSDDGWIAHDLLNFELIKSTVDLYEENKFNEAKQLLFDYYQPEKIENRLIYIKHIPEFQIRFNFIENALDDYNSGRYYSCIPLLIMVIDGVVNDVLQKGFHAQNIDLNVWDSITATDTGIQIIKDIFQRSRQKTTTNKITLPFRHGILHGRDLGYDNHEVACKCWAFLFVIRDWIISKKSENSRLEKFQEQNKAVSWKELFQQINELELTKKAIKEWKPREISGQYINLLNYDKKAENDLPEATILIYLEYWKNKNYGMMARLHSALWTDNYKKYAGEIREEYDTKNLLDYQIVKIIDESPSITEILVKAKINTKDNEKDIKFRCIYEKGKNEPVTRNLKSGEWKIVLVN